MFRRHNSLSFEAILEECLDRIATGDSISACLEDYRDHAEALRPILDVAVQMQVLPSRRLSDAADSTIYEQIQSELRKSAVSKSQKRRFHHRQYKPNKFSEVFTMMRRTVVPLGAIVAMALFSFVMFWQFSPQFANDRSDSDFGIGRRIPLAETTDATQARVTHTNTSNDGWGETHSFVLKTTLPESRTQMDVYYADPFQITTSEEAKQVAERLKISNPEPYRMLGREFDEWSGEEWYVIGDDGQTLQIFTDEQTGGNRVSNIQYSDSRFASMIEPESEPISFEEASKIAEQFFAERGLLPKTYRIVPQAGASPWFPASYQNVLIIPMVGDVPLYANNDAFILSRGDGLLAYVDSYGHVVHANIARTDALSLDQQVEVISAEDAYDLLTRRGRTLIKTPVGSNIRKMFTPPASASDYEIGSELTLTGAILAYESEESDKLVARFLSMNRSTFLLEDNEALKEIASVVTMSDSYMITGTVKAKNIDGVFEFAVDQWEKMPPEQLLWSCVVGNITAAGANGQLLIDADAQKNNEYKDMGWIGLKNLPDEIEANDYVEVCTSEKISARKSYAWSSISLAQTPDEPLHRGGAITSSMRKLELVESDELGELDETADAQHVMTPPRYESYESTQELQEVTIEGIVSANMFTLDGETQVEVAIIDTFTHPEEEPYVIPLVYDVNGDDAEISQVGLTNSISYNLSNQLAGELAELGGLYVRITGVIVNNQTHYKTVDSTEGFALVVSEYEQLFPDVEPRVYSGKRRIEEIDGNNYLIFTDGETGDEFAIVARPDEASFARPIQEMSLIGFVHPEQKMGAYPAMTALMLEWTSVEISDEQLSAYVGVSQVAENGIADKTFVVEQVALNYLRNKNSTVHELRPVWVFTGVIEETGLGMEYVIDAAKYE